MLSYKHILLATDLSKASDQVAKRSREIADLSKAKISVVHVLEYTPIAYGGEFSIPIDINLEQSLETNSYKSLTQLAKKYSIPTNCVYLEKGSVKIAVCELAEKLKVDLIIVGSHSAQGIEVVLGSHANAILHMAKCDVLVVEIKWK